MQVNLQVASLNCKEDADPVDIWGRPKTRALKTESVRGIFRGSKGGMLWKISSPVLETRYSEV